MNIRETQPENQSPPRSARWLLQRILRKELVEEVNGDLDAHFIRVQKKNQGSVRN